MPGEVDHLFLQIGQKDPLLTPGMVSHVLGSPDQCHLDFVVTPSGLLARVLLSSPSSSEIDGLHSDKAMLYAINHRGLLVGLLDLGGGFKLEFNYNAAPLVDEDWTLCRSMFSSGMFGGFTLCMTDISTGLITGLRFCSLSPAMTRFVYGAILDQESSRGMDSSFAGALLEDFWATYPDVSSLRSAMPVYCRLGSKAG